MLICFTKCSNQPVSESNDVTDDGHDGDRPAQVLSQLETMLRVCAREPNLLRKEVVGSFGLQFGQNLTHDRKWPFATVVKVCDALKD